MSKRSYFVEFERMGEKIEIIFYYSHFTFKFYTTSLYWLSEIELNVFKREKKMKKNEKKYFIFFLLVSLAYFHIKSAGTDEKKVKKKKIRQKLL